MRQAGDAVQRFFNIEHRHIHVRHCNNYIDKKDNDTTWQDANCKTPLTK